MADLWTVERRVREAIGAAGGNQHWIKQLSENQKQRLADCYTEEGKCVGSPRVVYEQIRQERLRVLAESKTTDDEVEPEASEPAEDPEVDGT